MRWVRVRIWSWREKYNWGRKKIMMMLLRVMN